MEDLVELAQDQSFSDLVDNYETNLLDFFTPSCVICRRLEPMLVAVAREFQEVVTFRKINAEAHPEAAVSCTIRGVPSLVLLKQGEVVDRKVGFVSASELRTWLRGHLS